MYLKHFGLKRKPFEISVDPNFIWLGEKHAEALATFKYGILENVGFLLLTGDAGTGKTSLINCLLKSIKNQLYVAMVPDPSLEILDFFNFISAEFGFKKTFDSKGAFLIHFEKFLHHAYRQKRRVLLIIDECQQLDSGLLEQIRLLSNIEMPHSKLVNIFFVGQLEFNLMLEKEQNRALRQRITVRYNLDPLTEGEIGQYVVHRLKVAGSARQIFNPAAIREIYQFSSGCPRLINIICDRALLTAYARNIKEVDAQMIRECAVELGRPFKLHESDDPAGTIDHHDIEIAADDTKKTGDSRAKKFLAYGILFLAISGLCGLSLSALRSSSLDPIKTWVRQTYLQFLGNDH